MKTLTAVLALLLTFATRTRAAVDHVFLATVTGSVAIEEVVGPGQTRIRTTPLDNARLFAAFGLSPHDYSLGVLAEGSITALAFYAKSAASPVGTVVFAFDTYNVLVQDTKSHAARFQTDVQNQNASGLFNGFAGSLLGTYKFLPDGPNTTISKVIMVVSAHGTNINGGAAGSSAVLTFKVVTGKKFVQGP